MNSKIAIQRIDNGLEKQATHSNPNLTQWDREDALNKAVNDILRRQIHGVNLKREGSEESTMRVDDLQVLLREKKMSVSQNKIYVDTVKIPADYRYYNRLTPIVSKGECERIKISSKFIENGNVDEYLQDWTISPSFEFEETFHSMLSNKFRVFHNGDFKIEEVLLTYYKAPQKISCEYKDLEKEWEWKEDFAELIIDEAIAYLGGNIQDSAATQMADKRKEENN